MTVFRKWWWLLFFVLFDIWFFGCRSDRPPEPEGPAHPRGCGCRRSVRRPEEPPAPPPVEPMTVGFPTAQARLIDRSDPSVFMPTASGRVESALYGSTRTRLQGGRALPAFHEGIDIAPLQRDASGRARDDIFSVADGTLVYANRRAGASSYGRYVVIEHTDPVGPVYSLYAHLGSVAGDAREGERVKRGQVIGRMGNSSTMNIPVARSHLHFEIGLMLNRHFTAWCRRQGMDVRHGRFHGWNLTGIDPLAMYAGTNAPQVFAVHDHLLTLPSAFEIVVPSREQMDYFDRYAPLWTGGEHAGEAVVLSVSHGGVVTAGRPATAEERERLGNRQHLVLSVNTEELGRNGIGLISQRAGTWSVTSKGARWLDILTYRP